MSYYHSTPTSYLVRSIASSGTKTENLLPFQFGIFDSESHTSLAPATVNAKRRVYVGVGSPNLKQTPQGGKFDRHTNPSNVDITFRSQPIAPKMVDILHAQKYSKDEKQNVYYLGYNGFDICESLKFDCGKTYKFHVTAKGRPVRALFGHEMREVIEITTGCCATCTNDCTGSEPCQKYINQLIDNFNNSLWVGKVFKAEKVINCKTALPALTTTNFVEYCLTVCDNGDEISLSDVQNQYPTYKVEVKSRNAPNTTYRIIKASGLPSAFTQTSITLQNCATCPSGFTANAAGFAYVVTIDDELYTAAAGSGTNAKLGTLLGVTVNSNSVISTATDQKVYYVVTATAIGTPSAGATVTQTLGQTQATCTQTTPTSTAWVSCDSWYKVQRDICITLRLDDCDADKDGADAGETLARLTTFLAGVKDYVPSSVTALSPTAFGTAPDCILRYQVSQYNDDFLKDGCDTYATAHFPDFPSFEGQLWSVCPCAGWTVDATSGCPIPPVPDDNCCLCGIKFTGFPPHEVDAFCGYDYNTYLEKDAVELEITVYRDDLDTNICDFPRPTWFHATTATYRQLRGDDVVKRIILQRQYEAEPWVNPVDKMSQLFLQREGIKLGIKMDEFYYAIDIYHNSPLNHNYSASHSDLREQVTLFVSEKQSDVFVALKAQLAEAFPNALLENY